MGAVWRWLVRGVVGVLAVVGLVAVWALYSVGQWLGNGDKTEPVPAVLSVPAPVPAVQVTGEAVPVCACGNGVWCEGPRGGKFCMTEAGAKRYKGGS